MRGPLKLAATLLIVGALEMNKAVLIASHKHGFGEVADRSANPDGTGRLRAEP